ncbi:MAG: haloacid dehalogenase-like hydrolase [Alphaproteobacteria bacterium]|nr:haloacid dehalogenase-like hydrolase [Alphaproteobacteria bacterium]MBQ8785377.1 haloacid dehalogenase-like hydrolase [Alphaproteobacteria bacterium]
MMKKYVDVALIYDFDGTLAAGNMQEYGFLKMLNIAPEIFWSKCDKMTQQESADSNLSYMRCMLEEAKARKVAFRREDFVKCGDDITFFKGVEEWFDRINAYALQKGIRLSHYIISSGLEEIALGSKIAKNFKQIYASSYMYDEYGAAVWPARVVNYTDKTQYLFRINKGCLDPLDKSVNSPMAIEDRPVPFSHMIYFGDGDTDVPCMSMIKRLGGYCISVFQPYNKKAKSRAERLFEEGRVNIFAPADYSAGKKIDRYVKNVVNKIASDAKLTNF